jgi:hypothetical protein
MPACVGVRASMFYKTPNMATCLWAVACYAELNHVNDL